MKRNPIILSAITTVLLYLFIIRLKNLLYFPLFKVYYRFQNDVALYVVIFLLFVLLILAAYKLFEIFILEQRINLIIIFLLFILDIVFIRLHFRWEDKLFARLSNPDQVIETYMLFYGNVTAFDGLFTLLLFAFFLWKALKKSK